MTTEEDENRQNPKTKIDKASLLLTAVISGIGFLFFGYGIGNEFYRPFENLQVTQRRVDENNYLIIEKPHFKRVYVENKDGTYTKLEDFYYQKYQELEKEKSGLIKKVLSNPAVNVEGESK